MLQRNPEKTSPVLRRRLPTAAALPKSFANPFVSENSRADDKNRERCRSTSTPVQESTIEMSVPLCHRSEDRISAGQRDGLVGLLYREHHRDLIRYLTGRFGVGTLDAEDVAQATFLRVADHPAIERIENYRAYLFAVACNIATDSWRKNNRWGVVEKELHVIAATAPAASVCVEQILLGRERLACIEAALRVIPKPRRRIFLLVRTEGESVQEVASRFAMSEAAIYKHVARALADCSAVLESFDARAIAEGGS